MHLKGRQNRRGFNKKEKCLKLQVAGNTNVILQSMAHKHTFLTLPSLQQKSVKASAYLYFLNRVEVTLYMYFLIGIDPGRE